MHFAKNLLNSSPSTERHPHLRQTTPLNSTRKANGLLELTLDQTKSMLKSSG
jgi:hypothetical protein